MTSSLKLSCVKTAIDSVLPVSPNVLACRLPNTQLPIYHVSQTLVSHKGKVINPCNHTNQNETVIGSPVTYRKTLQDILNILQFIVLLIKYIKPTVFLKNYNKTAIHSLHI